MKESDTHGANTWHKVRGCCLINLHVQMDVGTESRSSLVWQSELRIIVQVKV